MKTLRELVEGFGANGVIRIDDGNGSAGPAWIEWSDDTAAELGGVEMLPVGGSDRAYEGNEYSNMDTMETVARYVVRGYSTDEMYASEWIKDSEGDNPYRFRLIF